MGALCKLADAIILVFFVVIAVAAPLIDSQACFPQHFFPPFLVELRSWYAQKYGDYLVTEEPHFFTGFIWLELIFLWPLSLAGIYGIVAGKSWMGTTCLIYGTSVMTSMVAVLAELHLSGRASDDLLMMYYPFLGFGVVALLRGLFSDSGKSVTIGKRPVLPRKKRA